MDQLNTKNQTHRRDYVLRAANLTKVYSGRVEQVSVFRELHLEVVRGEMVAVVGPSGCGKSTLLHLLGGLDRPTSGSILFEGRPLETHNLDTYRARKVGFVFQSFYLLANLTAVENVQVPMFEADWPRAERAALADRNIRLRDGKLVPD